MNKYYLQILLFITGTAFSLPVQADSRFNDSSIFIDNQQLARTINIGYVLNSEMNNQTINSLFKQLETLKEMHFTAVRIPIDWISAMDSGKKFIIRESFLQKIDQVVQKVLFLKLALILDNHSDEELMNNPVRWRSRLLALWTQLAQHYKKISHQLIFEPLAEPHGNMNPYWNSLIPDLLARIRIYDPERPIIIGPIFFNQPDFLNQLSLPPNDRFIIVSFHQYKPVRFTMQGEIWFPYGKPLEWIGTPWPQKDEEQSLDQLFSRVSAWAIANHRPVFLGEFGVSSFADTASASRWIRFNRSEAEKNGFSWGYWSCFGIEFSLYNTKTQRWNKKFLESLMPDFYP